ncbi:hypothetical protein PTKIN_Ptkin19aG0023600 [Pterospermum kingtungense]
MRNKNIWIKIGERIGKLIMMDESLIDGMWTNFLRLQVKTDITIPLRISTTNERKEV